MSEFDPRDGLAAVVADLADLDERRAELVAERDMLMLAARDSGVSWAEIGRLSGLSVGAVRNSLDRARANQ